MCLLHLLVQNREHKMTALLEYLMVVVCLLCVHVELNPENSKTDVSQVKP